MSINRLSDQFPARREQGIARRKTGNCALRTGNFYTPSRNTAAEPIRAAFLDEPLCAAEPQYTSTYFKIAHDLFRRGGMAAASDEGEISTPGTAAWSEERAAEAGAAIVDGGEKFLAGLRLVAEGAQHVARHHDGRGLVDAAPGHAGVHRLDHHGDAVGLEHAVERVGDV